jgi:poly-beta-1,6-N-acetyl-D-glucosamine biosynthesis protein PgaD
MSPTPQRKPWPPVIQTALPAWMKWRDALLTLLMWSLFAFVLVRQFRLVSRTVAGRTDLVEFLELLAPYAGLAVLLIGLLSVAARLTERRREKALRLRPPAPLALADEARGVGLTEAALEQARALRIAVVHREPGGLRIQQG